MKQQLVSVVVPFYNEEQNVPLLAKAVAGVFAELPGYAYECLFVNDGSTDGTRAALAAARSENSNILPIHFPGNMGQSAALLVGMRAARGDYVLTLDGDMQNDPVDFPRFLELLQDHDCVCGYRATRHDSWLRKVSSRVANRVRNALLHDGIRDSGCGAKGFRREIIPHFVQFNGAHRFFAVIVRRAGFSIVECPVTHHARQFGLSKYGLHNRLWRGIYDLFGVAWLGRRFLVIGGLETRRED